MRPGVLVSAALVIVACACNAPPSTAPPTGDAYDPLAAARAALGEPENQEAGIPPACYTATEGESNPCWVCHTASDDALQRIDVDLQREYAFSDAALTNHWTNLFVDRRAAMQRWSESEILTWIRQDNLRPLADALQQAEGYPGYRPDLDMERGFDALGFALDGSAWRALRYKPFPGTFWPTNGSADDVFVRLPIEFRTDVEGRPSQEVYRINLAILEAAMGGDPSLETAAWMREIEPVDETAAGFDLDGDGRLRARVTRIVGLPSHYAGSARDVLVLRHQHPRGTEYLHSVRYVDPDAPDLRSRRLKELRYMRKIRQLEPREREAVLAESQEERELGRVPGYAGEALGYGLQNGLGWQLQAFIEDAQGRLRVQTEEEHRYCMGCHTGLGVTLDATFSMARKIPGSEGWRTQDLRGMQDAPQHGQTEPEILTYFERVGGADELRANDEMLARFWDGAGQLRRDSVLRASVGGDRDLAWLLTPSRARAIDLARAYRVIVEEQSFVRGRDASFTPALHLHREITEPGTGLEARGRVHGDGRLGLRW